MALFSPKVPRSYTAGLTLVLVLACSGKNGDADPSSTSFGSGETAGEGETGGSATASVTASGSGSESSASSGGTSTSDPGESSSEGSVTTGTGSEAPCGGAVYACGNGEDDDGDGKVDLADPECTGICDNDEHSFQTGIPGDNMDCWQDCFFDGDSGHGNDGCRWNIRCDPANPGADVGCEYSGGSNCESMPPDTPDICINFCAPLTPNGCDCFGCCTIQTEDGDVNVFLNSGPECRLDNLDACQSCTPNTECGNDCEPAECEVCFGGTLPEECDEPKCPEGQQSCTVDVDGLSNCPAGFFCLTGCCLPWHPEG